ncbi:MAG TPA: glutamate 5-kinase [Flavisolibacter sp.]|nr:glutamate 5-kinase [Flavisolibacter sp.]
MAKSVVVIKVGSSVLTSATGDLDLTVISNIVDQIADLTKEHQTLLVSSGAVSSGKNFLKKYDRSLTHRKAAAAIGNPLLIKEYTLQFSRHGLTVAQVLLERHHFSQRSQFLQLRETITELWANNVIPVINENDVVSNFELKFSDNDELATLLAIGFNANALLFCTTAGGYRNEENAVIPVVDEIDSVLAYLRKDRSVHGTGGMASKLTFTKLATSLGIKAVYCGINDEHQTFSKALEGKLGTTFTPKSSSLRDRQKWLASGSITMGSLQIDHGAYEALRERKSLLLVGVVRIERSFKAGEVVQLTVDEKEIVGVAKMKYNADALDSRRKDVMVAHADDIVLF